MISYVIGFSDPSALLYARKLGETMQLTNFLRDIGEDWHKRARIYVPAEDLAHFHVSPDEIASHIMTDRFVELMRFEIARADALYEEANRGIALLHHDGRFAVQAASDLYREILRKIEANRYNIFKKRVKTTVLEKLILAVRAYRKCI